MTNDYGNLELHMVLLQAMKDIDKICRENNLKYYLYAGSLLGAMNFKGFIPWDDDIDIVMFPKDYRKLKNIIEKDYDQYYGIYTFDNTPEWYSMMSKIVVKGTEIKDNQNSSFPIFIDVSELHSIPDSRLLRFIQRKKIEIYNLALSVLSGAVVLNSLKSKMTIGVVAKLGKNKLGNLLRRELVRYDNNMETEEEVDERLQNIMKNIFHNAYDASKACGAEGNLMVGANVAGFIKVADAMLAEGIAY